MPTFIVAPRPPSPTGRGAVVAVVAGAAMGALAGARVACHLGGLLLFDGCFPAGAQLGALVGALVAVAALPLLGEGTRRRQQAGDRPTATTVGAARVVWLAIAAALGRWAAQWPLNPDMELEALGVMALLPPVLVVGAGLAATAAGLLRRRAWARWAAVVAFSLLGTTVLAGLADWIALFLRTRAGPTGFEPAPVDLITPLVFLAVCVGVVVLLLTPTTRGDFQSSGQLGTPSTSGR